MKVIIDATRTSILIQQNTQESYITVYQYSTIDAKYVPSRVPSRRETSELCLVCLITDTTDLLRFKLETNSGSS